MIINHFFGRITTMCAAILMVAHVGATEYALDSVPSCFIAGDSIAQGIATQMPQCLSNTKIGLNTSQAVKRIVHPPKTHMTVISLGINDRGSHLPTVRNLERIRNLVHSDIVIWVLPPDTQKRGEVMGVAKDHHDRVIDMMDPSIHRYISTIDHIHPDRSGYSEISKRIRSIVQ